MKFNNLKIGTQLKFGFALLLLFVVVLGTVSYNQTKLIHLQMETLYDHPLKVQLALGALNADILNMRVGVRDLMLANTNREKQDAIQRIDVFTAAALQKFNAMDDHYLGPRSDIDEARAAFTRWNTARSEEVVKLALSGEIEKAKVNILPAGSVALYREQMLNSIKKIDDFAINKTDALYAASKVLNISLNRQLILLVVAILLLSMGINYILLRNIRTPLGTLTNAARRFKEGDMEARSLYESNNEFGALSTTFNILADSIQANTDLSEKAASLAGVMLSEDDAKKFFQATLAALVTHTGSQMAAVYLLNDDKKTFEHFTSIGMGDNARPSFAADSFEGEFGAALASRQTQHIKSLADDTRFVFHTASVTIIPREIITIPIANNDVVAVISLATVGTYGKQALQLIDNIHATLNSRIEGILAYRKILLFSEQLERQNRELEAQKVEMSAQSAELITQNTELEMQKNLLDEASRLKTNFLSNMSHELRTPLNSVIALSGVLNRRLATQIPEEEYSYLEVIERNGKLLLALINDILDIARIESGREEIEITKFNVNSLVAEVTSMIHPQAQQKNIELLHTDGEANLTLISDAVKCRHILQNLIANAVKFTEEGAVEISARQNDTSILISVIDTGIGIDSAHLPHIFDEFRQADSSTSRKFGGTGLGLAIAKKYAGLIGGTISVKSTPGKGSEFTLILPMSYDSENRTPTTETTTGFKYALKQAPRKQLSGSTIKTILLVEDSEPAIVQLRDILEEDGYQILVAHDGNEALGIIARTIPDAMVLDLMMPGIDGFEVLKTLRGAKRTSHIPVLILTAKHITKEELKDLKRNNVHQLIQKGDVNRAELQSAVATMVLPQTVEAVQPQRELQVIEGKPVVLVVEDNPDNMTTIKALLAGNYTLIEAVDGNEGIEMAMKHRPHLILMDIALPGMNGIETFKAIRKEAILQHIPVIALTASAMTSDRETILAHGFDAYIAKPIDEKHLFKFVSEALYGS